MAEESRAYPLVEALMRRSPLSRSWTIVVVAGVLLLLVVLTASLDGALASLLGWSAVGLFFLNILRQFFLVFSIRLV